METPKPTPILSKVFVVKYALTKGIIETDGEIKRNFINNPNTPSHCLAVISGQRFGVYCNSKEFSTTKEEAIKMAEAIRIKKIRWVKSQLKKLEKIKF